MQLARNAARPSGSDREEAGLPAIVVRLRQTAVCLLLVVTAFHQSAGLIGNDTKLDLTADPGRFLLRALDLWNPSSGFGQLQNQAYGYLFPMGAFHLLGAWLALPGWVVQRSWMALLLVAAFLGVLRLAARLDLGSPTTRLLGGLAYALSPRMLTVIGGNSSEVLPMAALPWVLVPLVHAAAELNPRRYAMRSGLAVLCMGAVNATAVLAVLPLPVLWLLPGLRRPGGRRLAAWWALAVTLASTWWMVPLLLQGRYSLSFLDYIETAATTTGTTSLSEVVRGTSHWLAYLSTGGGPWWRAGWTLVVSGGVVLDTAVLAALCAVGLLRRGMPAQGRLVAAVSLGLLAMSAAHVGPLTGPLAQPLRAALDGPLAPFRNVHKFDPLVRLPLALGLCHLLAATGTRRAQQLMASAVVLGLIGSAAPALAGQLVPAGGYASLPSWWRDTGSWLDRHDARGRALVLPATSFGEYLWGRPLDDPLQALTTTPWAVRDAVPLGSPGLTRLLDAINARVDTGHGSAALTEVLSRAGVRYLVVSNDLDRTSTGAPRPVLVHQALADSPGITLVAQFGPRKTAVSSKRRLVSDHGLEVAYREVEVYAVQGPPEPAILLPEADTWVVSGGPESLFALADRGLLKGFATVLAGQSPGGPRARTALTDDLRRREVAFGSVRDNASATLARGQPLARAQPVPDVLPVPGEQHLATARVVGAVAVSASSSASDAGAVFDRGPDHQPFAAFDGDPRTSWVSGSYRGATGQWVQIRLADPVDPTGMTVALHRDDQVTGVVTSVSVRTDNGVAVTALTGDGRPQVVAVPAGKTRSLRLTVRTVQRDGFATLVGLADVAIPGVSVQQTIVLPLDQQQRRPIVLLDRAVGSRDGCVRVLDDAVCSPALTRSGEDGIRLDRTFVLEDAGAFPLVGSALPEASKALDDLLDAASQVRATASSQQVVDPSERPGAVLDGDLHTAWVAGEDDRVPSLTLRLPAPRRLDRLGLITEPGLVAARPLRVEVVAAGRRVTVDVPLDGVLRFPPVTASTVQLRFVGKETRTSSEPDGRLVGLPVGLSEVTIPGVRPHLASPLTAMSLPCGSGPPVVVDGIPHPTAVLASRRDLLELRPVLLSMCDAPTGLLLGAGPHRVVAADAGGMRVEGLTLGTSLPGVGTPARASRVLRWDAELRTVDVQPGEAAYLVVHENSNRGWHATLDGHDLATVTVDGWQQAWVLPAGSGGRMKLTYRPGKVFHLALILGGLLVVLLVGLAVWPGRQGPASAEPTAERTRSWSGRLPALLRGIGGGVVTLLLGGGVGVALYGLLVIALLLALRRGLVERTGDVLVAVCGASLVLAGLLTSQAPWNGTSPPAALGTPVQFLALLALASAAAVLSGPRSSTDALTPMPAAPRGAG